MNKSHRNLITLGLVLALCCFACGKPTEQIALAQKAMDQAKEQRAEEFAAKEWNDAMQAWNQAQAALAKDSYSESSAALLKAKTRFEKARDLAKGRREELLKEVTGLQKTIDIRYTAVKSSLETAKLSAKQKKDIEESCNDIDQSIEKLKAQIKSGDLAPAKFTGGTTLRAVYDIQQQLQGDGKKK
ncbi:MAG TPA: DUF4398 domain-containing protein [Acidobacteriota bacterium]|nr:DUF4398 domain-containing protein [Acidobacteriota bacterium]